MALELQQLRPGDSFAGRYRVVRLIRAGGMGAVYEVEDTSTRRRRALKLMHPTLLQSADSRMRFQREVFIGAELETEHIVEVLDAGLDQATQTPYLAMELLKGEELGDRLERVRRMNANEVVDILSQVARALDKAHQKGIVHRDLKPENIYLTQREDGLVRAKILDFGIAKLVEGAQTSATQAAGTPLYMAPEQTDKMGHVSPVTDVWALGLVAYRMLVGTSYWQGDSLQQLYRQILMDPITSAVERAAAVGVGLPPGFDMWFMRCVARNPQERWPSAGQAVGELARSFNLSVSRPSLGSTPNPDTVAMSATVGAPGTLDPVANVTPGTAPHPATLYAQPQGMGYAGTAIGNVTPYPSPNITPAPHGPMTTPMPGPALSPPPGMTPIGAGTQVASPNMWQHGQSGMSPIPPAPAMQGPKKSGGNGAVIGAIIAIVLIGGGVGAYFAFASSSSSGSSGGATQPTGKSTDTPTKKPPADDDEPTKKESWTEKVAKLNSFLPVPMKDIQLQKHEVTREEYAQYVAGEKKARKPLDNFETLAVGAKDGSLPVTWVTFEMAEGYCKAIGGRLPTAEEWDAAVAGPDKRKYPWGNDWPKTGTGDFRDLAVGRGEHASPVDVGTSPFDKGPYGHLDLAGNVQEWTSSDQSPGKTKKVRGADIGSDEKEFKDPGEVFSEANAPMGAANAAKAGEHLGFRCAKDGK